MGSRKNGDVPISIYQIESIDQRKRGNRSTTVVVTRTRQGSAEKRHAKSIDLSDHRICRRMTYKLEPLHSCHGCPSQTGAICRLLGRRLDASTAQAAFGPTGDDGKSTGNLRTKVARHRRNQLMHTWIRYTGLLDHRGADSSVLQE